MHYKSLSELIHKHKSGQSLGIYSVCSANPYVITAALQQAKADESLLLIEATSNQVDQFGGYTGMRPLDFIRFVEKFATEVGFQKDRIVFGGDHLGPNAWQDLSSAQAMKNSRDLITEYVKAGFSKIHLDTSMRCADDPAGALDPGVVAARAADLCEIAEQSIPSSASKGPVYVIGTEVPIPGGAHEGEEQLLPSKAEDVAQTIAIHKELFDQKGLHGAWDRVIAVVAQPGVEFGSDFIDEYNAAKAQPLVNLIEGYDSLLYEAHSTDYQLASGLRQLVIDHFAILKVGPQLTFALREAILALAAIESELLIINKGWTGSNIRSTIQKVMNEEQKYWLKHYPQTDSRHMYEHFFSLSDRIRYYWPVAEIQASLGQLIQNLASKEIPLALLSQYLPLEYGQIREGRLNNDPVQIMLAKVRDVLKTYSMACGIHKPIAGDN
jgi:D-tagatose-1,6-bisphosphate aldolase subunit GatZ/KbaZ